MVRRAVDLGRVAVLSAAVAVSLVVARHAVAGETRCWIDKGALVAPAAFGGIAGDFLIDLSAPTSALHRDRAREDGLAGETATRDLTIAGEHLTGVTLAVADLDAQTGRFATTVNGVVGADLLRRFVVEIDPAPCRLRLMRRRPAPWKGSVRLTIREVAGRPLAPVRITDGVKIREGLFALDSADWESQVARARPSRPPPPAADGPAPLRLRGLELAGRLFELVPATVVPDAQGGAIGMAVLSRWRLRLDIRNGRLELAPAKGW